MALTIHGEDFTHIDLFSGIGGFALASSWVWGERYVNLGHSEVEKFPCKVYHKHFPESECLGDITKIDWTRFRGKVDLLTGGFPCQPHSVAGKRRGSEDERDFWGECVRAVREIRPLDALFENVPGLFVSNGGQFFNRVLADISSIGYDCEWHIVSAKAVGAPHKRERVWIVAHSNVNNKGKHTGAVPETTGNIRRREKGCLLTGRSEILADPNEPGLQGRDKWKRENGYTWSGSWPDEGEWFAKSGMGRMANGIPSRMDRLKSLGNAIVPQVAEVILRAIKEINDHPR